MATPRYAARIRLRAVPGGYEPVDKPRVASSLKIKFKVREPAPDAELGGAQPPLLAPATADMAEGAWVALQSLPFKPASAKVPRKSRTGRWKTVRQMILQENHHTVPLDKMTWSSLRPPPPMRKRYKLCDVTWLPAKYTDPQSHLQYQSAPLYPLLARLPSTTVKHMLAMRNVQRPSMHQ